MGSDAYYPGADIVDYVGLTVLGDEEWDRLLGNDASQSIDQLLADKYPVLAGYGKPMIIAELGVSGSPDHQREWLADAALALARYPRISAVVYDNAPNAANNHMPTEPDWRLSPSIFREFAAAATLARPSV